MDDFQPRSVFRGPRKVEDFVGRGATATQTELFKQEYSIIAWKAGSSALVATRLEQRSMQVTDHKAGHAAGGDSHHWLQKIRSSCETSTALAIMHFFPAFPAYMVDQRAP